MTFDQRSDLILLWKAINTSLRMSSLIVMPEDDEARLFQIRTGIENELKSTLVEEIKDEDDCP